MGKNLYSRAATLLRKHKVLLKDSRSYTALRLSVWHFPSIISSFSTSFLYKEKADQDKREPTNTADKRRRL